MSKHPKKYVLQMLTQTSNRRLWDVRVLSGILFYLWTQWFVVQAVLLLLFNKFPYFSIVANEPDVSPI